MTFTVGKYLNCIIKKPVHNKKTCTRVNTIQYNTIQYNTIQYNTIQYNTIQYNTYPRLSKVYRRAGGGMVRLAVNGG